LFADDVDGNLQIAGADDVAKLQYALDLITKWADEWQLSLSIAKCNTLSIGLMPSFTSMTQIFHSYLTVGTWE